DIFKAHRYREQKGRSLHVKLLFVWGPRVRHRTATNIIAKRNLTAAFDGPQPSITTTGRAPSLVIPVTVLRDRHLIVSLPPTACTRSPTHSRFLARFLRMSARLFAGGLGFASILNSRRATRPSSLLRRV